ncbi:MAG: rhodanese-like domain-containing protein [Burkholderiaceae bacterium]
MKHIGATELSQMLDAGLADARPCLLDVREPWETEIAMLPGSLCIPMGEVAQRIGDVPAQQAIVCICHHGVRSLHVARFLIQNGFETVYNLQGGIDAWAREVDRLCATY